MLFFATTINYLDRQVLSLTFEDFIRPEFHWSNYHYGTITGIFSLVYAIAMLFAGTFVDTLGTKKGYMWSIGIWSAGACGHAVCGILTERLMGVGSAEALQAITAVDAVSKIAFVSMVMFICARCVLAIGEAGNFPAAIKATAEYFPKKDRAFATSIFNAGSTIGALAAPFCIPVIAQKAGWEAAFIIIGALGFVWMGFWTFTYRRPSNNPLMSKAELDYIEQDSTQTERNLEKDEEKSIEKKISLKKCLGYRQTWAFAFGKLLPDGVWWFFLFWMPSILKNVYKMNSTDMEFQIALGVLYLIVMLSIFGGYLPTIFIEKKKMDPYAGKMRAMKIFAFFPLLTLFALPLSDVSYWIPIVLVGIAAAAHQSWSANVFSTIGDMFPKNTIATITGIGGMAGGIGSWFIQKGAGILFDLSEKHGWDMLGLHGIKVGYMIMFTFCGVAYLLSWAIMKRLVPKYKKINIDE